MAETKRILMQKKFNLSLSQTILLTDNSLIWKCNQSLSLDRHQTSGIETTMLLIWEDADCQVLKSIQQLERKIVVV